MSDPDVPPDLDIDRPGRSGTFFVIAAGVFLLTFVVFILVVSPRLQDQLGLNEGSRTFRTPPAPTRVPLTLDGEEVGVAIWDAEGVCAEITDATGTLYRACAEPDPLRPIWAIDAPDEADPPYLLVATPPDIASIQVTTVDGEGVEVPTQARELEAAWALATLPDGAVVEELVAFGAEGDDAGNAECGVEDAPDDGAARLQGGCLVPRQD